MNGSIHNLETHPKHSTWLRYLYIVLKVSSRNVLMRVRGKPCYRIDWDFKKYEKYSFHFYYRKKTNKTTGMTEQKLR